MRTRFILWWLTLVLIAILVALSGFSIFSWILKVFVVWINILTIILFFRFFVKCVQVFRFLPLLCRLFKRLRYFVRGEMSFCNFLSHYFELLIIKILNQLYMIQDKRSMGHYIKQLLHFTDKINYVLTISFQNFSLIIWIS